MFAKILPKRYIEVLIRLKVRKILYKVENKILQTAKFGEQEILHSFEKCTNEICLN